MNSEKVKEIKKALQDHSIVYVCGGVMSKAIKRNKRI